MRKVVISASSLPAGRNMSSQIEYIQRMSNYGADMYHLDVMDGEFVKYKTIDYTYFEQLREKSALLFDTHLMIVDPERYIDDVRAAGADIINFHVEATKDVAGCIAKIKASGAKVGITVKPNTAIETIQPYLADLDMVLVMTVEPGFGGQKFMADQVHKIRTLAKWKKELQLSYDIEVDGGITLDNIREVLDAGANLIVAGSAVFGKEDISGAAKAFHNILKEYDEA